MSEVKQRQRRRQYGESEDERGSGEGGQRVVLEQLDGPLASRILWRRLAAGEQVVSGLIAGRYRVGIDGREPFEITVPPGRRVLPATRLESSRPVEREGR